MATDKIRPCTAAELLAYHFSQGKDLSQPPVVETSAQQSFIDERILPSEELREEEQRSATRDVVARSATRDVAAAESPGTLAPEDYMTDADFDI